MNQINAREINPHIHAKEINPHIGNELKTKNNNKNIRKFHFNLFYLYAISKSCSTSYRTVQALD